MSLEEQIEKVLLRKENMISGFKIPYIRDEITELSNFYSDERINEIFKKDRKYPTKNVCFFKYRNGKYLAENDSEITTEILMNNEHAIYHDDGWVVIPEKLNK